MPVAGVTAGSYAESLPCVEANLEALLRHAGAGDLLTLTALGGPCTMDADPPASLRLRPVELGEWIRRCTGLELVRSTSADWAGLAGQIRSLAGGGLPVLVYADAFTVPWNPYAGHEHHEHAFVVDGADGADQRFHVVDAYTNATRYGRAEPRELWVQERELAGSLRPAGDTYRIDHISGTVRHVDAAELGRDIIGRNVRDHARAEREGRDAAALVSFARGDLGTAELGWLSLAIWLTTRSRALHTRWWRESPWLDGGAEASRCGDEASGQWQKAQTISYLAWRRVEAGNPCPPTLASALAAAAQADAQWFAAMGQWLSPAGPG
jgi:hypothetical protein